MEASPLLPCPPGCLCTAQQFSCTYTPSLHLPLSGYQVSPEPAPPSSHSTSSISAAESMRSGSPQQASVARGQRQRTPPPRQYGQALSCSVPATQKRVP